MAFIEAVIHTPTHTRNREWRLCCVWGVRTLHRAPGAKFTTETRRKQEELLIVDC